MGLDAVEIVMRTEELFGITISDEEAEKIRRVKDLYELICLRLNVHPIEHPTTSAQLPVLSRETWRFLFLAKTEPLPLPANVLPWSPQTVWDTYVAMLMDQQALQLKEIIPEARFAEDLGVD